MHTEEAFRSAELRREQRDRDRRRVRRDDRGLGGGGLDPLVDGELHLGALDDGFDDEVGVGHGLDEAVRWDGRPLDAAAIAAVDAADRLEMVEELERSACAAFARSTDASQRADAIPWAGRRCDDAGLRAGADDRGTRRPRRAAVRRPADLVTAAIASSSETTSPYFASMSRSEARAPPLRGRRRLPRDEHAIAVLQRVDGRRADAAGGGAPVTITVSRRGPQRSSRSVPKNADAKSFASTGSSGRRPRRASTSTQREPGRSVASAGAFAMNIAARSRSSSA